VERDEEEDAGEDRHSTISVIADVLSLPSSKRRAGALAEGPFTYCAASADISLTVEDDAFCERSCSSRVLASATSDSASLACDRPIDDDEDERL
jgi:hypothetical protein